jgi:hypothetical protein
LRAGMGAELLVVSDCPRLALWTRALTRGVRPPR